MMWMWLLCVLGCRSDIAAGQAALDAHDLAAAEMAFRQALARSSDDVDALTGLGWTYLLANQLGAAAGTFERCATIAPQNAECFRGLASIAMAENNLSEARMLVMQAQQLDPENPKVLNSVALMELHLGEITASEEHYRQLVRRYPDAAEYQLGLARLLVRIGGIEEARTLTENALALPNTPVRYRSMLWVVHAQTLLASVANREDPERCSETAPSVLTWLDTADRALDNAEATGVTPPDFARMRRQVARRRASVLDVCPMSTASEG